MPRHREKAYAEIRSFVHATEDPAKVEEAVKNLIPINPEEMRLKRTVMHGHHGNRILRIEAKLSGDDVFIVIDSLFKQLHSLDEEALRREFHKYIDAQGTVYLRFCKQQALKRRVVLRESDSISFRIRLGVHPKSFYELKQYLEEKTCSRNEG
ncbi:MAG: RNA-binding domain-containing protein [Candidatus Bathyarchaeia archaeon]